MSCLFCLQNKIRKGQKMSPLERKRDEDIIELAERLIAKIEALRTKDNSSNSDRIPTNRKIQNEPLVYES